MSEQTEQTKWNTETWDIRRIVWIAYFRALDDFTTDTLPLSGEKEIK